MDLGSIDKLVLFRTIFHLKNFFWYTLFSMSKTKQIKLTVDLDLFEQIQQAADEKELPISTYIRYVVANRLDENTLMEESQTERIAEETAEAIEETEKVGQSKEREKNDNVISLKKLLADENDYKSESLREKKMSAGSDSKKSLHSKKTLQDPRAGVMRDSVDKGDINIHIHV